MASWDILGHIVDFALAQTRSSKIGGGLLAPREDADLEKRLWQFLLGRTPREGQRDWDEPVLRGYGADQRSAFLRHLGSRAAAAALLCAVPGEERALAGLIEGMLANLGVPGEALENLSVSFESGAAEDELDQLLGTSLAEVMESPLA